MAKTFKFYNPTKTVNVEVVTDAIGSQETFTIADVEGSNALAVQKGLVFNEIGIHTTEYALLAKAVATNLQLAVYNDGAFIETLNVYENEDAEILTYSLDVVGEDVVIDSEAGTIAVELPFETAVTALVAEFTLSADATASIGATDQVSGETANNFSTPKVYVVTAEHGETKSWTVTVTVAADPLAAEKAAAALLEDKSVEVEFEKGEDKAAVLAAIKALEAENTLIQDLTEGDIEIADGKATVTFAEGVTAEVTVTVAAE